MQTALDKLQASHKAGDSARDTAQAAALAKALNLDAATVQKALASLRPGQAVVAGRTRKDAARQRRWGQRPSGAVRRQRRREPGTPPRAADCDAMSERLDSTEDQADLQALAAEAYIYGFALVFNLEQVARFTERGMGSLAPAPFNEFAHATQLAGPQDTFVSINNDTVYSMAQVDLGAGPLLLEVPEMHDRYYVLQFVDAWTNNFAYVGRRATGTAAGSFLLVPPEWSGDAPSGATVIRAPTRVFSIVGRIAVDGPDDMPAVVDLQARLRLTPHGDSGASSGLPRPDTAVPDALRFFEQLRVWMQGFPPAPADAAYQERFKPLGLFETDVVVCQAGRRA